MANAWKDVVILKDVTSKSKENSHVKFSVSFYKRHAIFRDCRQTDNVISVIKLYIHIIGHVLLCPTLGTAI